MAYHVLHIFMKPHGAERFERVLELSFDNYTAAHNALEAMSAAPSFARGAHYGEVWSYESADSYGAQTAIARPDYMEL